MDNFNLQKSIFNATDWAWHDIQDRCEFNAERVDLSASVTTIDISKIATGSRKFGGGILAPNGNIYFIPYNANCILKLNPETEIVEKLSVTLSSSNAGGGTPYYGGAVLGPDDYIYCIPQNAKYIMKIDTKTDDVFFMSDDLRTSTYAKNTSLMWLGAILASNNCIYAVPFNSGYILKIDLKTQKVSTLQGSDGKPIDVTSTCGATTQCFQGGVLGPNGKIYCIPYNAKYVGIIDPSDDTFKIGTTQLTYSNCGGSSAFYIRGALGADGKIYCMPSNATRIMKIDATGSTETYTFDTTAISGSYKFAGGVLAPNGNIYFMAHWTNRPYVIHTTKGTLNGYFDATISGSVRYEGGVLAPNGKIYCSPGTNNNILVISPAPTTNTNFGLATLLSPYLNKF